MRHPTKAAAIGFSVLFLAISVLAGCALLKKKETPSAVEKKSYTIRFMGYKTIVKVKAKPEEVEDYLFDPQIMKAKQGSYEIIPLTKDRLDQLGARGSYKIKLPGISVSSNGVLAYFKPGEEIWYLGQIESKQVGASAMGIIRFNLSQFGDETRLVERWEMETNELAGAIMEASNVREVGGKLFDQALARGQAHFDPSLTEQELLEKGNRGEFYDAFYQAHQLGVWINASPKKVAEYLKDPHHWQVKQDAEEMDFGGCLAEGDPGPCKIRLKTSGIQKEPNLFTGVYNPGEYTSACWVSEAGLTRLELLIKPEGKGTRLTLIYMEEFPFLISPESELMTRMMQAPKALEQLLINFKNGMEGTS